ncbi:MAG TPA: lysoplasmalogenase family protein, partial [Coriobacteriia bacterium]|nr:lysoplasmalogenase family protein [Coriobacteriia bacterium]
MAIVATVLTVVACIAAIVAFQREQRVAYAVLKVLASAGFITVALSQGVPGSTWRVALVAGLMVALVGDALLALRGTWAFVGGMSAFSLMHVCYLTGFLTRGIEPVSFVIAAASVATLVMFVWRRARAHLPERLRPAIAVYVGALAFD